MRLTRDGKLMLFGLGSHQLSWRGVYYLLWVYLGSLLFAAIVTGPVFAFFQWWAEVTEWKFMDYLADHTFDEFFDRLRMLPVLCGLPWLLVACGLFSFWNLGLRFDWSHRIRFCIWFAVGVAILAAVIVTQVAFTNVSLRENVTLSRWITVPLGAMLSGLAVALIEEIVFRGLIFRIFYTAVRPLIAIVLSSAFFAYVHFKVPDVAAAMLEKSSEWWMGFYVAFWMLFGVTVNFSWLAFLNLFVFGVLLCLIFLRTRSLLACMGLHAGVVWLRLSYIKLCDVNAHPAQFFWGGGKVIDGLFPLIIMVGICAYLMMTRAKETDSSFYHLS